MAGEASMAGPRRATGAEDKDRQWDIFQNSLPQLVDLLLQRQSKRGAHAAAVASTLGRVPEAPRDVRVNGATDAAHYDADAACDDALVDPRKKNRELVDPELLCTWLYRVSEMFDPIIFVREFIGQMSDTFFSIFAFPLHLLNYGSLAAMKNRLFLPHGSWTVYVGIISSSCFLVSWILFFWKRPKGISYSELVFDVLAVTLRNLTVATKYAHMPRPTWNEWNHTLQDQSSLVSFLIVPNWLRVTPEVAERDCEMSLISVLGPTSENYRVRFLPNAGVANEISTCARREGKTSRWLVERLPLELTCHGGGSSSESKVPSKGDNKGEMTGPAAKMWPNEGVEINEDGSCEIMLRSFFKQLVQAVIAEENSMLAWKMFPLCAPLGFIFLIILPGIGRRHEGHSFFGEDPWTGLYVGLTFPIRFSMLMPLVFFLLVAIKDVWRRRMLMRSVGALLSSAHRDRYGIPEPLQNARLLDVADPHTMESFRLLYPLCMNWGATWSDRCGTFINCFAVATLLLTGWVCMLMAINDDSLISTTLLLISTGVLTLLGLLIVIQAMLGGSVNWSARNVALLVRRHACALRSPASAPAGVESPRSVIATPNFSCKNMREGSLAAEAARAMSENLMAEHDAHPIRLLGLYCGFELLSAVYVLPLFYFSQLSSYCLDGAHHKYQCMIGPAPS